jgi:type IV pilus assembly protein PilB
VNSLIRAAISEDISDIHLEPGKDRLRVRFRQDGVLVPYKEFALDLVSGLTNRIKILAGADIAERRRHQDGRILYEDDDGPIDLRVSIYATVHGEKIVLRLLNRRRTLVALDDLGIAPRVLSRFREEALLTPSGVVLVTGPTGSGKTTTLYAGIAEINDIHTCIVTAEDPVEYLIDGISQCSINSKIQLTYEETLRHIVRQDPDVIVIGEIRDRFSADTAIQAALTGHKVLTTFHTEDSIGGLLRLLNMEIEAFLISSTVVSVVAQRLLRRVCDDCAEDHVPTRLHRRRSRRCAPAARARLRDVPLHRLQGPHRGLRAAGAQRAGARCDPRAPHLFRDPPHQHGEHGPGDAPRGRHLQGRAG